MSVGSIRKTALWVALWAALGFAFLNSLFDSARAKATDPIGFDSPVTIEAFLARCESSRSASRAASYFYSARFAVALVFISAIAAAVLTLRKERLVALPGSQLGAIADFIFPSKTNSTIFEPILRDLQDEHIEALSAGRIWKARWVVLRGRISFWAAVVVYVNGTLVRWFVKMAKPF